MKYMDRSLLPLFSRCSATIIIMMMVTGCLGGPGKIAIAPDVRSQLNDEPKITALRYANGVLLNRVSTKPFAALQDQFKVIKIKEEPLIPLMESFISEVQAELKLNNIHTLPEPRHHHPEYRFLFDRDPERAYDLIQLQRTFKTGLVFDFDRDPHVFGGAESMFVWREKSCFPVHVWAKARLIRIDDQKILWQGVCEIFDCSITLDDDFQFDPPDADNPRAHFGMGTASSRAQEKLDKAAKACAKELVTQFMGK